MGFSGNGSLSDADVCVFWADWRGLRSLTDASTDGRGRLAIDQHNDCVDFNFAIMPGGGQRTLIDISFKFRSQMALCAVLDGGITKLFTYVWFSKNDETS